MPIPKLPDIRVYCASLDETQEGVRCLIHAGLAVPALCCHSPFRATPEERDPPSRQRSTMCNQRHSEGSLHEVPMLFHASALYPEIMIAAQTMEDREKAEHYSEQGIGSKGLYKPSYGRVNYTQVCLNIRDKSTLNLTSTIV